MCRSSLTLFTLLPLLLSGVARPMTARAEDKLQTGEDFRAQLRMPVSFVWSENPLRSALANLSDAQRVAIFLDRRIDPGKKMNLQVRDQPLEAALRTVAAELGVEAAIVDPVIYLGPPDVASLLATVAAVQRDQIAGLPDVPRRRLLAVQSWQWPALATPADLLQQLTREAEVRLVNPELLPHDLWPAVQLPPMGWSDRLTLLLAGFSLTFDVAQDGSAIRLRPFPEQATLTRTYPVRGSMAQAQARLAAEFPDVSLRRLGSRLEVAGRHEDHYLIERFLRGETVQRTETHAAEKRFRLNLQNTPVGAILRTLEAQLQLTFEIDPDAGDRLKTLVNVQVDQATLDEVLAAALEPAGLTFQREERVVKIGAGD